MSIVVFHNAFGDHMNFVAQVMTDSMDVAYRLTNSIDNPWFINDNKEEIVVFSKNEIKGIRSTSIGDIMIDLSTNTMYIVASFGFDQLELDTVVKYYEVNDSGDTIYMEDTAEVLYRKAIQSMIDSSVRKGVSSRM